MERLHPAGPGRELRDPGTRLEFHRQHDGNRRVRTDLSGGVHLLREGALIYVVASNVTLPIERWPQMPDAKQYHSR